MLFYLIKNNLKLMLRSKIIIVLMIIGPLITIAALSSAFQGLLSNYKCADKINVQYCVTKECEKETDDILKIIQKQCDIRFEKTESNAIRKHFKDKNYQVFVEFKNQDFTIYRSKKNSCEGKEVEFVLATAFQNMQYQENYMKDTYSQSTKNGTEQTGSKMSSDKMKTKNQMQLSEINIKENKVSKIKKANAIDYYGITEIVYFLWCGIISLGAVFASEKKNHIPQRYYVTTVPKIVQYLGKAIPCILANLLEIAITIILTSSLYDIHWGNIPGTILVIVMGTIAMTAIGLFLFELTNSSALSIIILFMIIWIWGFFGGSFETYMFSEYAESIKRLSPLYYMNRTLVEYSVCGKSSITGSCIRFLLLFSVLFFGLGILAKYLKRER